MKKVGILDSGETAGVSLTFYKLYGNDSKFVSNSFFIASLQGVTLEQVAISNLGYFASDCTLISDSAGYYHLETTNETMLTHGAFAYVKAI